MSEAKEIVVYILDKEYRMRCPAGQESSLREAANYLDEQMRAIRGRGRVIGLDRIAVMAALNMAHELLQVKQTEATASMATDSSYNPRLDTLQSEFSQG